MDDVQYLNLCLKELEQKFDWGISENWTKGDFERFSEVITQKTGISISAHTLQRLYGKIKTQGETYKPQYETKNALAIFLGYENWESFVKKNKNNQPLKQQKKEVKSKILKYWLIIISIFVSSIGIYLCVKNLVYIDNYIFKPVIISGQMPLAVKFECDFSKLQTKKIRVEYGDSYSQMIDKSAKEIIHTYNMSGLYKLNLFINDKAVNTFNILVKSIDWDGKIFQGKDAVAYLRYDEILDSGKLYVSPERIKARSINRLDYTTEFRKFEEFMLDADNFSLETRVLNNKLIGGIPSYDFKIRLDTEKGKAKIHFCEPGCQGWVDIEISENNILGEYNDLSVFATGINEWSKIVYTVKDKQVKIYLNDKLIYHLNYLNPLGKLRSIRFSFRGSGAVDYVKCFDSDGIEKYSYDFN